MNHTIDIENDLQGHTSTCRIAGSHSMSENKTLDMTTHIFNSETCVSYKVMSAKSVVFTTMNLSEAVDMYNAT